MIVRFTPNVALDMQMNGDSELENSANQITVTANSAHQVIID
jgi:hypothetical protein